MKNFITIAALVVMSVITLMAVRSCNQERRERTRLERAYEKSEKSRADQILDPIRTVTDTIYMISGATVAPQEARDMTMYVSKGYADTMKQALNIAVEDLERMERFTAELQDSIRGLLEVDTNGTQWAILKDNVFDVKYNFATNMWYPKVRLDFDVLGHKYKPGFFSKRQVVTTIVANDPRVQIGNIRSVNKITLPSRFGLDVTVGPVATPHGLTYGVGVGLGYRVIEF